ncbi:16 kDa phloem protein 2-like isoform X1 [Pyrus communis]|uniref:16 kDa phloem protein 2-like isoform X1 n=1 Tax=Pyrus communis TaxID=23211 RepID=UPI0035C1928B
MPLGTLEVLLVEAKGLKNKDFLSVNKMDPYVIFTVKTQEKKSTVAKGKGSDPEWNESFLFTVTDDVSELRLKIMDKDTFTKDDFVGEAIVPLEPLFADGRLPPTAYNIVNKDQEYRGEIIIGLTFTPEPQRSSF